MDDAAPIQTPKKPDAAARGYQIWRNQASISPKKLQTALHGEGYTVVRGEVAIWLKGWKEEARVVKEGGAKKAEFNEKLNETIHGKAAETAKLMAESRMVLQECELDQVANTFKKLMCAADAISEKIVVSLPDMVINGPEDIVSLSNAMSTMAAAGASMQESAAAIAERRAMNADKIGGFSYHDEDEIPPAMKIINQISNAAANPA